jgi:hypothetical protein
MKNRKDDAERIESDVRMEETKRQPRRRKPRVKPLPRSMQDPRHDPNAAFAAIKAVLQAGGTPVDEAEFNERRNRGFVEHIPSDNVILVGDGQVRYRSAEVATGPGHAKSQAERMIAQAESAFARSVNEINKVSAFEAKKTSASQIAAEARTRAASQIASRVYELFDASPLATHNRAAGIARTMAREGSQISERRVREILARHRKS